MSYNKVSHDGIGEKLLSYLKSGTVTSANIGKAASMVAAVDATDTPLAKVGAADEPLRGLIRQVSDDGLSVQYKGMAWFPYTGTAPTVGLNYLECGAAGAIQVDATNGRPLMVETVNTTTSMCLVDLG